MSVPKVHIPDTEEVKEKALAVATAYQKLSALQFTHHHQLDGPQLRQIAQDNPDRAMLMQIGGLDPHELADDYETQLTAHSNDGFRAQRTAAETYRDAKTALYNLVADANPELMPVSHHGYDGFVKKLNARQTGKERIEDALNGYIAMIANDDSLRLPEPPDSIPYYQPGPAMGVYA